MVECPKSPTGKHQWVHGRCIWCGKVKPAYMDEITSLRREGWSVERIAEKLNLPEKYVQEAIPKGYRSPKEVAHSRLSRKIRIGTPVKEYWVETTEKLAEIVESLFKSTHIMGRAYKVTRTDDWVDAETSNLKITLSPPIVEFQSLKGNITFMRRLDDLTEVVAGEEVISFHFTAPKETITVYPATETIVIET